MPKLAANLTMLFAEAPFEARFAAAVAVGFRGVEYLFPYDHPAEEIARAARDAGVETVLFNLPPGDWTAGERGLAALPGREAGFEALLDQALHYAREIGTRHLHVMAGIPPGDADPADCRAVFARNLALAARRAAPHGITVLIEPINRRDIPGYFLNRQDDALTVLDAAGAPNAALQMDLYHCQIVEGDLTTRIRANIARIGHFQIAGVPDRHEPDGGADGGEVNYPYLFDLIDGLGYDGWIGCEYRPRGTTRDGLGWAARYGISAA